MNAMAIPVNKSLNVESIFDLEKRISQNIAKPKEYEWLDENISFFLGEKYTVANTLDKIGLTYEEYIKERKKSINERSPEVEGSILGEIIGTISALKYKLFR